MVDQFLVTHGLEHHYVVLQPGTVMLFFLAKFLFISFLSFLIQNEEKKKKFEIKRL